MEVSRIAASQAHGRLSLFQLISLALRDLEEAILLTKIGLHLVQCQVGRRSACSVALLCGRNVRKYVRATHAIGGGGKPNCFFTAREYSSSPPGPLCNNSVHKRGGVMFRPRENWHIIIEERRGAMEPAAPLFQTSGAAYAAHSPNGPDKVRWRRKKKLAKKPGCSNAGRQKGPGNRPLVQDCQYARVAKWCAQEAMDCSWSAVSGFVLHSAGGIDIWTPETLRLWLNYAFKNVHLYLYQ